MKKNALLIIFFVVFAGMNSAGAQEKLDVFVTILPQSFLVEAIGKDKVDVTVMIPPGGNPHTFEPAPSQLTKLSQADLYVKVGTNVEFELDWMNKLVSFNKEMRVCDASEGIELIDMAALEHHAEDEEAEHHEEHGDEDQAGKDPHIWLSPANAVIMANNIKDALIEIDPANVDHYSQNTNILIGQLEDLEREIKASLAGITQRTFLIFHPAWGYFAADFGLTQIAAEHMGKELTPKQLAALIRQAKELGVKVIFVSPQFSPKSAEVIAAEIKGAVLPIDPLAKDYIANLRQAANAFKENM